MDICHITLTSERRGRLPLFSAEGAYRAALHRIGRVFDGMLALFGLVTEHLHLLPRANRRRCGRLAQATIRALQPIVATPLATSHITPVETRSHLRWLVRYFLEQPLRHGVQEHPAVFVGSCFPDLVGARVVPGLDLCIRQVLPTFTIRDAAPFVGLQMSEVSPASRSTVRQAGQPV